MRNNRTFVVLKSATNTMASHAGWRNNRTFVVLKFGRSGFLLRPSLGNNRTFVVLKSVCLYLLIGIALGK